MLIKIILFCFMLLNQNDVLIKQHDAKVSTFDIDSYVHDQPDFVRKQLSQDIQQLEKDILGILNMNIIYDYIKQNNLLKEQPFKSIVENYATKPISFDESFYLTLDIKPEEFKANYRLYNQKKELYSALQNYIISNIDIHKAEQFARDRFLINKSKYMIAEKRDIGMIELSLSDYSQEDVVNIVSRLVKNDTQESFKKAANEFSTDKTVKYNDGQLGQFHKAGFRYPFADEVFSAKTGVVPSVFQNDNNWYILRVNEIIPAKPADFEAHKKNLVDKIKTEIMEREFQNIINQYAQHEVQVNKQLVDDIFSRYEVFQ